MRLRVAGAAGAGVATALASALCCAGPILALTIGVSGAGLASTLEPYRPYLLGASAVFLGLGFLVLAREERIARKPGRACASKETRRRMRQLLWLATLLAVVLATYPTWRGWVLPLGR